MAEEKKAEVTIRNLSDEDFSKVAEAGLCATSLKLVNSALSSVDIHNKDYVTVPERVKAFRTMCPDGAITTDIVKLENDEVVIRAVITDGSGKTLATGLSQESKSSSYINKSSFVENCETSAVGRALGFLGIGSAEIRSAEEMANAINTQEAQAKPVDKTHLKVLRERAKKLEITEEQLTQVCGCPLEEITIDIWDRLMKKCEATEKARLEKEAEEIFK